VPISLRPVTGQPQISTNTLTILGITLLVFGITTSLILGVIGSLLASAAVARRYGSHTNKSRQALILVSSFLGLTIAVWIGLSTRETFKRSCIPEGNCPARYQLNSFERLDNSVFGMYGSDTGPSFQQ
jgi:uncharacterized membrane protein YeaQ/YmgE (transglycosylase-associated protein family)